jgi:regulator of protease activity HflC (stomatin/prohibitin superfamily)
MININDIDRQSLSAADEKDLLRLDPEAVRTFYSLTGPARREYIIQLAEAEAERIRILRQAQAEGLVAIRNAEAEGLRRIGEALAAVENPEHVIRLAALMVLQEVARVLGEGKATKLFLPQSIGDVFSLLGSWRDAAGSTDEASGPGSPRGS